MKIDQDIFNAEIYELVAQIPQGKVCTYGMLARLAGKPAHARWVGKALAKASESCLLPCHRVVNSQGRIAPHWSEQQLLLEREGVLFKRNGCVDLSRCLWPLL